MINKISASEHTQLGKLPARVGAPGTEIWVPHPGTDLQSWVGPPDPAQQERCRHTSLCPAFKQGPINQGSSGFCQVPPSSLLPAMETQTRWLYLETIGLEAVIFHGAAHSKSRGCVWCYWIGVNKMQTHKQGEVYGSRITMHLPTLSLHGPEHELWCTNNQPSRTIGYEDVGQLHNGQKLSVN